MSLLSNSAIDAQAQLSAFERASNYFGLHLNPGAGKTEVMHFGRTAQHPLLATASGVLPECDEYKYLGWHLNVDGDWTKDFAKRKQHAWYIMRKFRDVWTSSAQRDTKLKVFFALIVPILTHASFTYPNTQRMRVTLHTTCNALRRYSLQVRIEWSDPTLHEHTESLYSNFPTLPCIVAHQFVSSFGHWCRHVDDSPAVQVLVGEVHDPRSSRRTRPGPARTLYQLTELCPADLANAALDRKKYAKLTERAARTTEFELYESHILKHRLGGPPSRTERRRIFDLIDKKLTRWFTRPHRH